MGFKSAKFCRIFQHGNTGSDGKWTFPCAYLIIELVSKIAHGKRFWKKAFPVPWIRLYF